MRWERGLHFVVLSWLGLWAGALSCGCGAASPSTRVTVDDGRPTAAPATIDDLAWLAGRWQTEDGRLAEEWSREGESLRGRGISYVPVDCVLSDSAAPEPGAEAGCPDEEMVTETLEITGLGSGLVYIASPVGQSRTEFVLTEADGTHFVAENPEHDFPTRIEYQHVDGTLRARVSGPEREFELVFVRR